MYCGCIVGVLWVYCGCIVGVPIEEVPPISPCWQIMGTKATILIIIIFSIIIIHLIIILTTTTVVSVSVCVSLMINGQYYKKTQQHSESGIDSFRETNGRPICKDYKSWTESVNSDTSI